MCTTTRALEPSYLAYNMGQKFSHEAVFLETRVEDPTYQGGEPCAPKGLALIAHGRGGSGNMNEPLVRRLAEYLVRERHLRVVTWNARGVGKSGGRRQWEDMGTWVDDAGVEDYNVSVVWSCVAERVSGISC